jgi:predicted nicotinamide N-methyase
MSVTEISIPGGWGSRAVTIAGRTFDLLLPAEPDEFLNQLDDSENAPWPDLYWAQLWPAAVTTANFIAQAPWPAGTSVLEVGCGIGLVGLAALAAGYGVTYSDYVPLALDLALENAARNGFNGSVGPPSPRGLLLDWHAPPDEQFPVIAASDVLYYRDCHEALLGTLTKMLAPGGECWIGDPGRSAAEEFVTLARQAGWKTELLDDAARPASSQPLARFRLIKLARA